MSAKKFKYKYEIAASLEISARTLRRLLNVRYYDQLKVLGYEKKQKYLLPSQLNWLAEKLDFEV